MTAIERTTANLMLSTFDQDAVMKHLGLNPRDPATQALLLVCQKYDLDPILKHALLIKGRLYVTRDGLLHVAHRSGVFDGMEVIEQGDSQSHHTAKVSVWRKDMGRPFSYIGRYPKTGQIAKDYGPEMAVKVAEVMALRRAFDVALGAAEERWDEEAQREFAQVERPAQDQARTADVTREVQEAGGTPAHTTAAQVTAPNQEALDRVVGMAERVRKFGEVDVQAILNRHAWQTDMEATKAVYKELTDFGKKHSTALTQPASQPVPQAQATSQQPTAPTALPADVMLTDIQRGTLHQIAQSCGADTSAARAVLWAHCNSLERAVSTADLTEEQAATAIAVLLPLSPEERRITLAEAQKAVLFF